MSADVNTGTREFILPDLGEGLTEAELISWKVEIGDEVHVDQMVVEVESAKSVVELPARTPGRSSAFTQTPGTPSAQARPCSPSPRRGSRWVRVTRVTAGRLRA